MFSGFKLVDIAAARAAAASDASSSSAAAGSADVNVHQIMPPTSKARPNAPSQPDRPPSHRQRKASGAAQLDEDDVTMSELRASCHTQLDPIVMIWVSEQRQLELCESAELDDLKAADMFQGAFYQTQVVVNGEPVFSKIAQCSDDKETYLFKAGPDHGAGWYVASCIFSSESAKAAKIRRDGDKSLEVYLWCSGDNQLPDKAHFPYWASKSDKGIYVASL